MDRFPSDTLSFDVVVVGAGTAGASAALNLARSGAKVALLERRSLDSCGPRWVNAVPAWMFDAAGIERPVPPEAQDRGSSMQFFNKSGQLQFKLDDNPAWKIDMRLLVHRLIDDCRRAGVECFEHLSVTGLTLEDGRPVALEGLQDIPKQPVVARRFRARLFVDATGLSGAIRKQVPLLRAQCPEVASRHLISAAQEMCEIADPDHARAFLDSLHAQPEHVLAWFGMQGGYSTVNILADAEFKHADLLVGTIVSHSSVTGPEMLRSLKKRNSWLGRGSFGGAGLIPIRRPYDRLVAPGIALIGDSACQVFPAHGSGIGLGMIAGKLLADAVGRFHDPGSIESLWGYQVEFQRSYGSVLAFFDMMRRALQEMSGQEVDRLIEARFLNVNMMRQGMDQKPPQMQLQDLSDLVGSMRSEFSLGMKMGRYAARLPLVFSLYKGYPKRPNDLKLRLFSHAAAKLFGEKPDIR